LKLLTTKLKGLPGIIGFYDNEKHYDLNPKKYTIADIINWLLENHSIWISVLCDVGQDKLFTFKIYSTKIGNEKCLVNGNLFDTPTEAYLAAIKFTIKII